MDLRRRRRLEAQDASLSRRRSRVRISSALPPSPNPAPILNLNWVELDKKTKHSILIAWARSSTVERRPFKPRVESSSLSGLTTFQDAVVGRGFESLSACQSLRDRLTVGQQPLELNILVRIQAPQLFNFRSAQISESSVFSCERKLPTPKLRKLKILMSEAKKDDEMLLYKRYTGKLTPG